MKYFIVNVKNCLPMSQYAPFFYEHIYNGDLVILDEIKDTCQLDKTYQQLVSHLNRKPFAYEKSVVLLFIPRKLTEALREQDYELYNDINIYTRLLCNLNSKFKVYTFYVDRTGPMGKNEKVYQQLKAVNESLQAKYPELKPFFLSLEGAESAQNGSYKDFLRNQIEKLCACTRPFYLKMLEEVPEMSGTPAIFQSGLNNFIGQSRGCLSQVKHLYAPVYWQDISKEIEEWFKIIYYIKEMIAQKIEPEEMPDFEKYTFDRYNEVRQLIATYRNRLHKWASANAPIDRKGYANHWEFRKTGNAAAAYHDKVNKLINEEVEKIDAGKNDDEAAVEKIFSQFHKIIADAKGDLQDFGATQSACLLDPNNYQKTGENEFDREGLDWEDKQQETALLEKMNNPTGDAAKIPDFSAENKLEQDLDNCLHYIRQIVQNLEDYKPRFFIGAFLVALLSVFGIYIGAQYSIFLRENSWWIMLAYLGVTGLIFGISYLTVRRKYRKEIESQIADCKIQVTHFLSGYKALATSFEQNTIAAGQYNCLRRELEAKQACREEYKLQMQMYAWHKMKVEQILRDMGFFDGFVGDTQPLEESNAPTISLTHDPEHAEFYLMKVFRR